MRETSSAIFAGAAPTAANFVARAHALFGDKADEVLKLYPAGTDDQAKRSAQDLAGDQFIAFSTWKWIEMQVATGNSRVFRYEFDDAPPAPARTAPLLRAARTIRRKLSSFLRRWPRKTSPGGREDEKLSRSHVFLLDQLRQDRGPERSRFAPLAGLQPARTITRSCISAPARMRLRTSTAAGTNSLTRCLPGAPTNNVTGLSPREPGLKADPSEVLSPGKAANRTDLIWCGFLIVPGREAGKCGSKLPHSPASHARTGLGGALPQPPCFLLDKLN